MEFEKIGIGFELKRIKYEFTWSPNTYASIHAGKVVFGND